MNGHLPVIAHSWEATNLMANKGRPGTKISLRPVLSKLIPICFATGAAMEYFMIKTGFCTSICLDTEAHLGSTSADLVL